MLGNDITLCIAGNKVDLEKERHVTVDEAETYVIVTYQTFLLRLILCLVVFFFSGSSSDAATCKVERTSLQGGHLPGKPGKVREFDIG